MDESSYGETLDLKEEATVYRPLSATVPEIRLIKLKPEDGSSEFMNCTLDHHSASDPPAYVALSYCWGKSSEKKRGLVNGREFRISTNLWSALYHLRARGDVQVWCDRLCINQADDAERAQQIGRMKSIFQHATRVVVWLGEEADGSGQFMETLNRWARRLSARCYHSDSVDRDAMWRGDALNSAGAVPEDRLSQIIAQSRALFDTQVRYLLQRPYWRRAWVIQEVSVGNRVTVHCGPHSAGWDELVICLRSLRLRKAYYDTSDPVAKAYRTLEMIQELRAKLRMGKNIPLLRVLQDSYGSEATDPRDKIFALLGLCFDARQYVPVISYEFPLRDTVLNMTVNAINNTRNLDLICMQGLTRTRNPARDLRLPTWVPNWLSIGNHPFNDRMVGYLTGHYEESHFGRTSITWHASADTCYRRHLLPDEITLTVDGALVGVIDGLTPAVGLPAWSRFHQSESKKLMTRPGHETLVDVFKALNFAADTTSPYGEAFTRRFFRSIKKDRSSNSSLKSVRDWFDLSSDLRIRGTPLREWTAIGEIISNYNLEHAPPRPSTSKDRAQDEFTLETSVEQALAKILRNGMRLMTTMDGDIGWAHPLALPGDGVFLLHGCSMPVILRELNDDRFQVIGDAYVSGIMQGELWQQASEMLQTIYLQ
jgi:hypothetical protein